MADDERRIDVASADSLQQDAHVFVCMGLSHFQRQTFREGGADWKFIDHPAIDAWYGNGASFAASVNRLT